MMDRVVFYISGAYWDEYMAQCWEMECDRDSFGMWCAGGEL